MADRFDKFTERARRVLTLSSEQAESLGSPSISSPHLLLAVLEEGGGVAHKVLSRLNVEIPLLKARLYELTEATKSGDRHETTTAEIGLDADGKRVIELAVHEARALDDHYIGTEHLLLALISSEPVKASEALESVGVTGPSLRDMVKKVLRDPEDVNPLLVQIASRCRTAGIDVEPVDVDDETTALVLKIQAARTSRSLTVRRRSTAESLLATRFEAIRFIVGYVAIFSSEDSFLEAELDVEMPPASEEFFSELGYTLHEPQQFQESDPRRNRAYHWLLKCLLPKDDFTGSIPDERLEVQSDSGPFRGARLSVGVASDAFKLFREMTVEIPTRASDFLYFWRTSMEFRHRPLTIRVDGIQLDRHDQALKTLEALANSVLFSLDHQLGWGVCLALEKEGESTTRIHSVSSDSGAQISFPQYQYDPEPMSLYWYARRASGMPLVQYLAYYQVIEFFFPVFAARETREVVKMMLKDPSFSTERDVDLARLIDAVGSRMKSGYGDERTALHATLSRCVTEEDLRAFMVADNRRLAFFESKEGSPVSAQRIRIGQGDRPDLVHQASQRVYEIRCKIVHTKLGESGSATDVILPFSTESQKLSNDIALVEFLARKVLVATARPLDFAQ